MIPKHPAHPGNTVSRIRKQDGKVDSTHQAVKLQLTSQLFLVRQRWVSSADLNVKQELAVHIGAHLHCSLV
jgi:hypothetical protein